MFRTTPKNNLAPGLIRPMSEADQATHRGLELEDLSFQILSYQLLASLTSLGDLLDSAVLEICHQNDAY